MRDSVLLRGSISLSKNATAVIEGNEFSGDLSQVGVDSGSVAEVRGNTFTGSAADAAIWIADRDTSAVVTANTVTDSKNGLRITGGGTVTIEDDFFVVTDIGISVAGTDAHIEGNTIGSDGAGIVIVSAADPTITGNTIEADGRAIIVAQRSAPVMAGNVVCGGEVSILVDGSAGPRIGDNEGCEDTTTE